MSNTNTGGPEFPTNEGDTYDGMTLRDYFAAKAMQAELTNYGGANWERVANSAYEVADAIMEVRSS